MSRRTASAAASTVLSRAAPASGRPTGRTGQREANAKADEWLDKGVKTRRKKVADVWPEYLAQRQLTTSESNWKPMESRWRIWIAPNLGQKKLEALTDQDPCWIWPVPPA